MIEILRTDSSNPQFIDLVRQLDDELAQRDGDQHEFYHQFNTIDNIKHAIIALKKGRPQACGAIKHFDENTMEVKRMYTLPECRGMGLASIVLKNLENWAVELGYKNTVLETGKRNPEAIALYQKYGYSQTPNYGQYIGIENSVCFLKELNS